MMEEEAEEYEIADSIRDMEKDAEAESPAPIYVPPEIFFEISQYLHYDELSSIFLVSRGIYFRLNTIYYWKLRTARIPPFFHEHFDKEFFPSLGLGDEDLKVGLLDRVILLKERLKYTKWSRESFFFLVKYCEQQCRDMHIPVNYRTVSETLHSLYITNKKWFEDVSLKIHVMREFNRVQHPQFFKNQTDRVFRVVIPGIPTLRSLPYHWFGNLRIKPQVLFQIQSPDSTPLRNTKDVLSFMPFPKHPTDPLPGNNQYNRNQPVRNPGDKSPSPFNNPKYSQCYTNLWRFFDLTRSLSGSIFRASSLFKYLFVESQWKVKYWRPYIIENIINELDRKKPIPCIIPQVAVVRGTLRFKNIIAPAGHVINNKPFFTLSARKISYYEDSQSENNLQFRNKQYSIENGPEIPPWQAQYDPHEMHHNFGRKIKVVGKIDNSQNYDHVSVHIKCPSEVSGRYTPKIVMKPRLYSPNSELRKRKKRKKLKKFADSRDISGLLNEGDIVEVEGRCLLGTFYTPEIILRKKVPLRVHAVNGGLMIGCWTVTATCCFIFKRMKWPKTMKYMVRSAVVDFLKKMKKDARPTTKEGWIPYLWDLIGRKMIGRGTILGGTMIWRVGKVYTKFLLLFLIMVFGGSAVVFTSDFVKRGLTRIRQEMKEKRGKKKLRIVVD